MRLLLSLLLPSIGAVVLKPRQNNSSSSCEVIYDAVAEAAESGTNLGPFLGKTAVGCLREMPYDSDLGQSFIEEFTKYMQFQSTLELLADPPETYKSDGVDLLDGLKKIAKADHKSQFDFDYALGSLLNSAHDGHLSAGFCSLQPFIFHIRSSGLVSVSKDGKDTPEVYFVADLAAQENGWDISPVAKINGEDLQDFLNNFALELDSQDPDTRWNRLFMSRAVGASDANLESPGRLAFNGHIWIDDGAFEFEFRNGSSIELPITASLGMNSFESTGEALFESLCLPVADNGGNEGSGSGGGGSNNEENGNGGDSQVLPPAEQGPLGYPEPWIRDPYNQMLGFELDDDTMVMRITTFGGPETLPANQSAVFSQTATEIVDHATSTGRSKIIIDVSSNLGGNIVRGFDLFKLFFPDELPYSATRFRRHDAMDTLAQAGRYSNSSFAITLPFLYPAQVTPDQESDFGSVDDFLGDKTENGVDVSSLFANFNYSAQASEDGPIRGYGVSTDLLNKAMPFKPEDILIVGDGNCVSTCTTFVNLMTNVGGVRSLAFGGRPKKEPMQIMGGVRGAQSAQFSLIETFVNTANQLFEENGETSSGLNETWPIPTANFPLRLGSGNINLRNAYQDDNSDLPLQFEYQAADCRLFFTYDNVMNPGTTWSAAKDAIWGDAGCVDGSTGGQGSKEDHDSQSDGNDDDGKKPKGDKDNSAAGMRQMGGNFLALTVSLAVVALM